MKKLLPFLGVLSLAVFFIGCGGVPKEAVEGLKKDIDELGAKITSAESMLVAIVAGSEKEASGKLSKEKSDELLAKIDGAKGTIGEIVTLETEVDGIRDSLAVLDKKATGDIKKDIGTLSEEVAVLKSKIGEFKSAIAKLDEIKAMIKEKAESAPISKVPVKKKIQKKVK